MFAYVKHDKTEELEIVPVSRVPRFVGPVTIENQFKKYKLTDEHNGDQTIDVIVIYTAGVYF